MSELFNLRRDLNRDLLKFKHAVTTLKEERERLVTCDTKVQKTTEAQQHLQLLAQKIQQQTHKQITKIVSRCMAAVFPDPYSLRVDFVRLRGKTEAKLIYYKEGHEVDPLRTSGGVLDISSLGLRIAQMLLSQPQSRKLLILDEPFGAVSAANLPKAAALLGTLSKEMQIQMVLVTHSTALEVGKVISL